MAYIKTEQVKSIRDQIKAAYPVLQESDLPFDNVHEQINEYWYKESDKLNTKTKMMIQHVLEICNSVERCYDRNVGDPYADYGDSTYFIDFDIGQWDKPYKIGLIKRAFSRSMTHQEIGEYRQECERNRSTLPAVIEIPEPVKPAGYLAYLNLTITEEVIG